MQRTFRQVCGWERDKSLETEERPTKLLSRVAVRLTSQAVVIQAVYSIVRLYRTVVCVLEVARAGSGGRTAASMELKHLIVLPLTS